jgi:multiple sugar transport system permease protein
MSTLTTSAIKPQSKRRIRLGRVLLYGLLILSALLMALPLLFGVAASIASIEDYIKTPWFPIPYTPTFENYRLILGGSTTGDITPVTVWVRNTLIRAAWYIIVPAIVALLGGYALAKLRFKGRDAMFIYLLSSLVLPPIVYLVPTFVMMARWPLAGGNDLYGQGGQGLINQWPALLITGLVNVFYIFMFRQTFITIPNDFEEAARVDGADTLRCLWDVYLPMLKPTLVVLVIFQFVAIWNDYIWPTFVVTGNKNLWVLAQGFQYLGLAGSQIKGYPGSITDYPFLFAMATFAILPLLIMYFLLQRFFVEGVQGFAIKG